MKKRALEYAAILVLSGFLFVKGFLPGWNTVHSDFSNYYVASRLVVEKADLTRFYDNDWFQQQIHDHGIQLPGKFAPFPPITAWIMLPLTPFDVLTAQRIWTLFNLCCLGASILLLRKITGWRWTIAILFILLNGLGIINNLAFGQMYLLMSAAIMLGFYLVKGRRFIAGGILFGIFSLIKYFPVIFLLGYELAKLRRVVVYAILTMVILVLMQWIFFGTEVMFQFVLHVLLPHLDGKLTSQDPFSYQFQSWDSLFRLLFVVDPVHNPAPLFPHQEARVMAKIILITAVGSTTGVVLWKAKKLSIDKRLSVFLSLPALAAMMLLPASATYHFVLLIFPVALLLQSGFLKRRDQVVIVLIYGLIGFIPYRLAFYLAEKWSLFFGYPRLWLVSLLFIVTAICLYKEMKAIPPPQTND